MQPIPEVPSSPSLKLVSPVASTWDPHSVSIDRSYCRFVSDRCFFIRASPLSDERNSTRQKILVVCLACIILLTFSNFSTLDDVSRGISDCRAALNCVTSVANAADHEATKLFHEHIDASVSLPAKLLASTNIMIGVEGGLDALVSVCGCLQQEQQRLQQHATDMQRHSKHMLDASSDAASLLSDAIATLDAARSALDVAVYKSTMRQQSLHAPKVAARRAAYDAEACICTRLSHVMLFSYAQSGFPHTSRHPSRSMCRARLLVALHLHFRVRANVRCQVCSRSIFSVRIKIARPGAQCDSGALVYFLFQHVAHSYNAV